MSMARLPSEVGDRRPMSSYQPRHSRSDGNRLHSWNTRQYYKGKQSRSAPTSSRQVAATAQRSVPSLDNDVILNYPGKSKLAWSPVQQEQWRDSMECRNTPSKIAANSTGACPTMPHVSMDFPIQEAAESTEALRDKAMLCYFTNRVPLPVNFVHWVESEMTFRYCWPVRQVKFLGKNAFMLLFDQRAHRDQAVSMAPWFMDRTRVYTKPWEPGFDLSVELPVPPVLERCKYQQQTKIPTAPISVRPVAQQAQPRSTEELQQLKIPQHAQDGAYLADSTAGTQQPTEILSAPNSVCPVLQQAQTPSTEEPEQLKMPQQRVSTEPSCPPLSDPPPFISQCSSITRALSKLPLDSETSDVQPSPSCPPLGDPPPFISQCSSITRALSKFQLDSETSLAQPNPSFPPRGDHPPFISQCSSIAQALSKLQLDSETSNVQPNPPSQSTGEHLVVEPTLDFYESLPHKQPQVFNFSAAPPKSLQATNPDSAYDLQSAQSLHSFTGCGADSKLHF